MPGVSQLGCMQHVQITKCLYLRSNSCLAILNNKLVHTFQFICWGRSWNRDLTDITEKTYMGIYSKLTLMQ